MATCLFFNTFVLSLTETFTGKFHDNKAPNVLTPFKFQQIMAGSWLMLRHFSCILRLEQSKTSHMLWI